MAAWQVDGSRFSARSWWIEGRWICCSENHVQPRFIRGTIPGHTVGHPGKQRDKPDVDEISSTTWHSHITLTVVQLLQSDSRFSGTHSACEKASPVVGVSREPVLTTEHAQYLKNEAWAPSRQTRDLLLHTNTTATHVTSLCQSQPPARTHVVRCF